MLEEQAKARLERARKLLEVAEECMQMGVEMSPLTLYMEDPVFGSFVTRESEAELIMQAERDIILALTFNRFRQKSDEVDPPNADLDYDDVEY